MGKQSRRKRDQGSKPAKNPIRFAVGIQVVAYRKVNQGDAEIRSRVLDNAKAAMEHGGGRVKTAIVNGQPMEVVNGPAIFLLAFAKVGVDYLDPHAQETLFACLERTIDQIFAEGY